MAITPTDQLVIESRNLLAETKNKDAVVRVLLHRGMAQDEACAMVDAIYKQTRWENRKAALVGMAGSGVVVVSLLAVWIFAGRLFYLWLTLAGLTFLWSTVKFCTASGYDFEEQSD